MGALIGVLETAATRGTEIFHCAAKSPRLFGLQRHFPTHMLTTQRWRTRTYHASFPFAAMRNFPMEYLCKSLITRTAYGFTGPVRSTNALISIGAASTLATIRARHLSSGAKGNDPPKPEKRNINKDPMKALDLLHRDLAHATREMAGYPVNLAFNYSKLFHFLNFHINNVGDPFSEKWYYKINTLDFEKEVIDQFAELFHAPKDNYWGYVTNGGTEGNLYGLYVAREMYPDGVTFCSDQSHYSVEKNLKILRMTHVKVKSQPHGEIDYQALQVALTSQKKVPIIVVNVGTTMTGAVDDVVRIRKVLSDLKIDKCYIHCDAAFFGMILPFLPESESQPFDFRTGIDSMAISGHKMIGTPFPCGVVLTKRSYLSRVGKHIEYTGVKDTTLSGSRNGHSPLFLWYEFKCSHEGKMRELVQDCLERAEYAVKKLNDHGINAWRNKNSPIVVFPKPSDAILRKWQIAAEGEIAHIITLPQVTYKVIDQIVEEVALDLKKVQTRNPNAP